MPVENFSMNPDSLNIQYIPLHNKIESYNPELYGHDQTVPFPLKLTSKSPIYGPGFIVENRQKRPLSQDASILEEKSEEFATKKAAEDEKKAK
jgi:hypothetical protein